MKKQQILIHWLIIGLAVVSLTACQKPISEIPNRKMEATPSATNMFFPTDTAEQPTLVPNDTEQVPTTPTDEATVLPTPNDNSIEKSSEVPTPTPADGVSYITPYKIKAGDFTLEMILNLSSTELRFRVDSKFPAKLITPSPDGSVPGPIKNVEFKFKDLAVEIKPSGGGGGGGGNEVEMGISQESVYSISPALEKNKKVHVTALVTFNDYMGIANPIPFEYIIEIK